ncbi:MAG: hypothetical protein WC622_09995 [Pedobacter sp.]|jgi:hypothetical protein|uniref:hypothetical protein n=1 Tax=Pedobacter sp. TaxID=1411316 RepID=UPI0035646C51
MKKTTIMGLINKTIGKNQMLIYINNPPLDVKDLIGITFYKEEQIAFRATWILANIY